ncbi:hypothetical protein CBR_g32249 [Chara braunii]|uniref:Peptidase M16 N-terminal domain-containing protein n=1 Tax=Chara braunii TaxID=69332 RepID=A0A388JNE9_CHABU|nr:hypothetical protein CBR_g32249 [Chara braunii]|eukprot:GBG59232.1 hypothetical protein CBR_g32249 [Chara braunii]
MAGVTRVAHLAASSSDLVLPGSGRRRDAERASSSSTSTSSSSAGVSASCSPSSSSSLVNKGFYASGRSVDGQGCRRSRRLGYSRSLLCNTGRTSRSLVRVDGRVSPLSSSSSISVVDGREEGKYTWKSTTGRRVRSSSSSSSLRATAQDWSATWLPPSSSCGFLSGLSTSSSSSSSSFFSRRSSSRQADPLDGSSSLLFTHRKKSSGEDDGGKPTRVRGVSSSASSSSNLASAITATQDGNEAAALTIASSFVSFPGRHATFSSRKRRSCPSFSHLLPQCRLSSPRTWSPSALSSNNPNLSSPSSSAAIPTAQGDDVRKQSTTAESGLSRLSACDGLAADRSSCLQSMGRKKMLTAVRTSAAASGSGSAGGAGAGAGGGAGAANTSGSVGNEAGTIRRGGSVAPPSLLTEEEIEEDVGLQNQAPVQQFPVPPMGGDGVDLASLAIDDDVGLDEMLSMRLPSHPKLHRGQLKNGLRYVILPNKVPPNRFEAHLEMHVGSVDELEGEQGIAHLIEHVTFLGSKKRERLLGTGARSNAYTDFHHTVFHVHAPVMVQATGEPMLPLVLEALHEIAFKPKFLPSRIEKERRAVLSELQMMNTIEYRVDCQLLQQLHSENLLGSRFPIGLEERIRAWEGDQIRAFHERWYFPANATLFLVGDLGSVSRTIEMIEAQFGSTPPGMVHPRGASAAAASSLSSSGTTTHQIGSSSSPSSVLDLPSCPPSSAGVAAATVTGNGGAASAASSPMRAIPSALSPPTTGPPVSVRKERHAIRPPVEHRWSVQWSPYMRSGYAAPRGSTSLPHVFQHELLQHFSLSVFCKTPVRPVVTFGDLRNVLMQRILLSALQFRINARYKSASPPFIGIELDHSDSGREGCAVTTLTVTAEPRHWEGAVKVGVQEVKRLREFGVTRGELTRYLNALLKDSEHLAAMIDNIPSVDNLDFIMESDALGHTVMDQQQGHACLTAVAQTVTLADVNATAEALMEYVADFGSESAPIPAAIVACVPKTVVNERGEEEVFSISPVRIGQVITEGLAQPMSPEPDVEVPKALIPPLMVHAMKLRGGASFVPLYENGAPGVMGGGGKSATLTKLRDEVTGVVQRRLSNGIRVNYKRTQNEARGGMLRVVAEGGRAREVPELSGAVAVGVRTLSEGGAVGKFTREQVELFCVSNLINCVLEADEEFLCMDFRFTMRDGGMQATFQLLHMVLEHSVWLEDALERAKQLYLSHYRSMPKSLERATAHRLMSAMFGGDRRFLEPSPEAIARLTLSDVREVVMKQLATGNLEVSVVGDFEEEEVERCLLDYLGTLTPTTTSSISSSLGGGGGRGEKGRAKTGTGGGGKKEKKSVRGGVGEALLSVIRRGTGQQQQNDVAADDGEGEDEEEEERVVRIVEGPLDPALRHQQVFLRDTDDRACAYIAGAAPNRWGYTSDGRDLNTIVEPVPPSMTEEQAWRMSSIGVEVIPSPDGEYYDEQQQGGEGEQEGGARRRRKLMWKRKRHPLYGSVSLALLAEIINARLFTTVRDALGLTYDVSFELSLFDRLKTGWFVISVTSTPAKIEQAVEASLNVLRGVHGNRVTQRELDRAKRTLLMRHESDLKDNAYWLGLLTHLQAPSVERKDVGCIKELPSLYEMATTDDIYHAYEALKIEDDEIFTCVGIAGGSINAEDGEAGGMMGGEVEGAVGEEDGRENPAVPPVHGGRGSTTMTRPTT